MSSTDCLPAYINPSSTSDSSQPSELSSGEQIIGTLQDLQRYIPGFIIVKLNDESILVPARLSRKLKPLVNKVVCVTQIDERYSVLEVSC